MDAPRSREWLTVLAAVCVGLAATVVAGERPLSLADCVRIALEKSPTLASQEWETRAAEAARGRASAERMPRLDLTVEASESERAQRIAPPSVFGERIYTDEELIVAEARMSVPLYQGGALKNRVSAAARGLEGARFTLTAREQRVILEVVRAYTRIQEQRDLIRALKANLRALQANLDVTKSLEEVGRVAPLDALKVEVRLAALRQQLSTSQLELDNLKTQLARLMGQPRGDEEQTVQIGWTAIPVPDSGGNELVQQALQLRPELAAARADVERLRAEVATAKSPGRPQLRAFAAYTFRGGVPWTDLDTIDRHVNYAWGGVSASVPLWTGGRVGSAVVEAKARLRSAESDLEALELLVAEQVKQAYASYREALSRREVAKAAVAQATEALSVEESSYEVGRSTVNDVLDAQAALLQAQQDEARAGADLVRASTDLLHATGISLRQAILGGKGSGS